MTFDLSDYEPVEVRLARFWADHPAGRVITDLVRRDEGQWVVRAEVYRDVSEIVAAATGYAHEVDGQGTVNRTSALENCETSAVGRALANAGYAPKGRRPSREEMAATVWPDHQAALADLDAAIAAAGVDDDKARALREFGLVSVEHAANAAAKVRAAASDEGVTGDPPF